MLGAAAVAASPCGEASALTLLGFDTRSDRALFSVSHDGDAGLLVLDGRTGTVALHADSLAGRRSGASHGPGAFLAAVACGGECLQPVRWDDGTWIELGAGVAVAGDGTLHFTYSADGAPWMLHHQLVAAERVTRVEAWRWDGARWRSRGVLRVRGIGAPAAVPDPERRAAILVGTGRFAADHDPEYWLPALPAPAGAPGGQVVAVAGGAAYLTFDARLYVSTDGGRTWFPERWTPWDRPTGGVELWRAGEDYWLDLPPAATGDSLPVLWYDERRSASPSLRLTRWHAAAGWRTEHTLPLAGTGALSIDQALTTSDGGWLLLGPCRSSATGPVLDVLRLGAAPDGGDRLEIPLPRP